mmetsp:Transcript_2172/g.3224  ORF Transcript_2172/g.3224 Transcript_2172/m.3224 type:complete len:658 (-) Transcript_2172:89-2062(-)
MPLRSSVVVQSVTRILNVVNEQQDDNFQTLVANYDSTAQLLQESIESCKRKLGCIAPSEYDSNKKTKMPSKSEDKENISCNIVEDERAENASSKVSTQKVVDKNISEAADSQTNCFSAHPRYLSIMAMKVVALRKELKAMGLETSGLKKDLQTRILTAIVITKDETQDEVEEEPNQTPPSKIFFAPSIDKEKEISEEIQDVGEDVEVKLVTQNKGEKADRMSISLADQNSCTEDLMSLDEIESNDLKDDKSTKIQFDIPVKVIKDEELNSEPSKVKAKIALFSGKKGGLTKYKKEESKKTAISPFKSFKKTFVKSATHLLSAASPKKVLKRDTNPAQPEICENSTSTLEEKCQNNLTDKSEEKDKINPKSAAKTSVKEIQRQLAEAQEKFHTSGGKGGILSNSAMKTTSSKSSGAESAHTLSVSSTVKEKQKQLAEARAKRLAEMRGKSKPLTGTKQGISAKPFSSLKKTMKKDDKRTLMTAKIREKHAALKNQGLGTAAVLPKKEKFTPRTEQAGALTVQPQTNKKSFNPPSSTKNILSPLRSPLSTYEISDREGSDSDDSEDSEYSKNDVKKKVPSWAQKPNLIKALHAQYDTEKSERFDPDSIFPEVETCDLAAIFNKNKSRFKKRASTGNWLKDSVTVAEKLTYKRDMGFSSK